MDKKTWLCQYAAMAAETMYLKDRLIDLEEMGDAADLAEVVQVKQRIAGNTASMQKVRQAVQMLQSPMERMVLQLRYMDLKETSLMKWKDVAWQLYGGDAEKYICNAKRLHNRAINHLQIPT